MAGLRGGALLAAAAAAVLRLAGCHWSERRRILGLRRVELGYHPERGWPSERSHNDKILWLTLAVVAGVPAMAAAIHLFWKLSH